MANVGARKPNDSAPTGRWFESLTREVFGPWRERRVAHRTSVESLRLYRELESAHADLTSAARYGEIVARRTGLDQAGVRRVLRQAEDSFARWPVERPLKLRDVVQVLVVHECLRADPSAIGTRTRLTTIIAEVIPGNF
jgi:hypothetical protein